MENKSPISQEFIAARLLDYQEALITRRWHGLLGYFVINGFLFHAMANTKDNDDLIMIAIAGFSLGMIFLRLIHVLAVRLEKIQKRLLDDFSFEIIDIPLDGKFTLNSITTLVLVAISILSLVWLAKALALSKVLFLGLAIIGMLNLVKLRWIPTERKNA